MVRRRHRYTPRHTQSFCHNVYDDDFDSHQPFGGATGLMMHNIYRGFYLSCVY